MLSLPGFIGIQRSADLADALNSGVIIMTLAPLYLPSHTK